MADAASPASSPEVRIRVIGGPSVGKTVLIRHHALGCYSDEYDPTDGSYRVVKSVNGTPVLFDVDDIQLESFSNGKFLEQIVLDAYAVVTVIEPTRPSTSDELERVLSESLHHYLKEARDLNRLTEAVVVFWCGDEQQEKGEDTEEQRAGLERARCMAERAGGAEVCVVKARSGEGVAEVFEALAIKVLERRRTKEGGDGTAHKRVTCGCKCKRQIS